MRQSSIKKNFAYHMIYEILILILPFVTSPYISRVIGAEGLGTFSYSYSIAYYFVLFSMLGMKNYGNRTIAQQREDKDKLSEVFSNLIAIHILFALLSLSAYTFYIFTLKEGKVYAFIQIAYVLSGLFDISWFYFGLEEFKITVTRNIIIKLLSVVFIFTLVKTQEDLWKYCAIISMGALISQLMLWFPLKKYIRIAKPCWSQMVPHIKPLLVLFIPVVAVSLYKYMDKIMIGSLSSKAQLGYYENAEKVINIPLTIISAFGTVMLPKMSNLTTTGNTKVIERYIEISMEFVMWISFALAFGLAAVSKVFATIMWGREFAASGPLIMGLATTIPFISFANIIRTQYLIPNEKDKDYLVSVIAGAVVNLLINWFLIPSMGATGAMLGTIIAEITVCLIQYYTVMRKLPLIHYLSKFIIFALYGAVMFVGVYNIGQILGVKIITLIIQILSGGIFYCILSVLHFYHEKNSVFMGILETFQKMLRKE